MSRFWHVATATALALAIFALGSGTAGPPAAASQEGRFLGDADCSESIDPFDSLSILAEHIDLSNASCGYLADVQCDGDIDADDALQVLRFSGDLPVDHQPSCPAIGTASGPEPDPLIAEAELDSDSAVTAIVGAEGGAVTAVGADGATFVLSIPEGALLEDEEITLTPVLSIADLPLSGGLISAVFIAPQDLVLLEPATLAIQTGVVVDDGFAPTAFGLHDGEFFLNPMFPTGTSASGTEAVVVTLPDAGGGVGLGAASDADVQLIVEHSPTDPRDLFKQRIADILRRSPNGPTPETLAEGEHLVREFHVWDLQLLIGAAAVDCDTAWTLVRRFLSWVTPIQIGMTQTAFAAERADVQVGIAVGMANCFEDAYQRCLAGGDRRAETREMFRASGVVQLGIGPEEVFRQLVGSPEAKLTECSPCLSLGSAVLSPPVQDISTGALPCGWRGTIEKSDTQDGQDWHSSLTMTGELTWRRRPENYIPFDCESESPPCVVYFATGTIQWHYTYSIHRGDHDCEENRSGSFQVHPPSVENWWQQSLTVRPTDTGIEYMGHGDYYLGDTPAQFEVHCQTGTRDFGSWLFTGFEPFSSNTGVIQGTYIIGQADPPGSLEYSWSFQPLPE